MDNIPLFRLALQFVLVTGLAFAMLCLLASHLRFRLATESVSQQRRAKLSAAESFRLQVIDRLARWTAGEQTGLIAWLQLIGDRIPTAVDGKFLDWAERRLRGSLRSTDLVFRGDSGEWGLLIRAGRKSSADITRRIMECWQVDPADGVPEAVVFTAHLGMVSFPENAARTDDLLVMVHDALQASVRSGMSSARLAPVEPSPGEPGDASGADHLKTEQSYLDPVTGVLRSAHLPSMARKYIARYRRQEQPVALLLVEIDYLGRYREQYGPAVIDVIFNGVAGFLQGHVREEDLIARTDSDAFVLLMGGCPAGHALGVAQRLATQIRKVSIVWQSTPLKISASLGAAACPDHGGAPSQLFSAATTAIHAAQARGPGLCELFTPAMTAPVDAPGSIDRF